MTFIFEETTKGWLLVLYFVLSKLISESLRFSVRFRSGLGWRHSHHIHTSHTLRFHSNRRLVHRSTVISHYDIRLPNQNFHRFRNRQASLWEICFIFKHHSGLLMTFQLAAERSTSCATAALAVPPFTGLLWLHIMLTRVCDPGWNLFFRWTKQIRVIWSWRAVVWQGEPDCSWCKSSSRLTVMEWLTFLHRAAFILLWLASGRLMALVLCGSVSCGFVRNI